jgi:hypothetical protein
VGLTFQGQAVMRSREHANVPTYTGVVTRLQVERRIANVGDPVNVPCAGRFHGPENQIWSRASLRHVIAADDSLHDPIGPAKGV